jgi:hypothetical protein
MMGKRLVYYMRTPVRWAISASTIQEIDYWHFAGPE